MAASLTKGTMAEVTAELECTRMVMRNLENNDCDDEVDNDNDDDDDEMLMIITMCHTVRLMLIVITIMIE